MINAIMCSNIRLSKRELPESEVFLLRRRLTLIPRSSGFSDDAVPIHLFSETNDYFFIPRYSVDKFAGHLPMSIVDSTSIGNEIKLVSRIKMRDHQIGIMDKLETYFKCNTGGIAQCATGVGKTVLAIEFARRLGRTTIIKVYKDDLADQWAERIKQFVPEAKIGRIQGDICDYKGKDFVIAMIQTLVSRREDFLVNHEICNYFGLEIVDECHRVASREWSNTAALFNAKYRLGLSATVDRKDRCEEAFLSHIGPIILKYDKTDMVPSIYFKETGFKKIKPEMDDWLFTTQMKILSKNYSRNLLIAGDIVKSISVGRRSLVLSKFVDHLHSIEKIVSQLIFKSNLKKTTGFYTGEVNCSYVDREKKMSEMTKKYEKLMSNGKYTEAMGIRDKINGMKSGKIKIRENQNKEDLKEAMSADVLFATFKKAEDAFDHPVLDTLFYALPISDVRQSLGRILRVHPDKKNPMVVDYTDDDVKLCENLKNKRQQYYCYKKYKLIRPKV